jgi:1,4-alpha-glucan branching enzyme
MFMLAEWENHPPHFETAFQMDYNWVLLHLLEDIAQGKKSIHDLNDFLQADFAKFPMQNIHMNFTTNHDENSHNGSISERYGDAAHAMNALVFTLNGMPLIYSGQEVGLNKRLNFYDKDEIDWSGNEKEQKFYKILLQLKHNNKALWNGEFGGPFMKLKSADEVLAYFREKDEDAVAVIINLSNKSVETPFYPQLRNYFNIIGEDYKIDKSAYKVNLGPWGYIVLANKI